MSKHPTLYFGIATVVIFWLSTIIAGFLHQDYNHINDTVSELGAIGTRSHDFMAVAMGLTATSGLLFSIGLVRKCKHFHINLIPALTTMSIPFSLAWVVVFPSGTERHSLGGFAMFSLYIGMILAVLFWKNKELRTLRIWSGISFVLMALLFLRFTPFIKGYDGLLQRFAHLGWSVWFVSISICFAKLVDPVHVRTNVAI